VKNSDLDLWHVEIGSEGFALEKRGKEKKKKDPRKRRQREKKKGIKGWWRNPVSGRPGPDESGRMEKNGQTKKEEKSSEYPLDRRRGHGMFGNWKNNGVERRETDSLEWKSSR